MKLEQARRTRALDSREPSQRVNGLQPDLTQLRRTRGQHRVWLTPNGARPAAETPSGWLAGTQK